MAQTARITAVSTTVMAVITGTPVLTLDGELPVEFLQPGDRIRMEISRIGVLEHQIAG